MKHRATFSSMFTGIAEEEEEGQPASETTGAKPPVPPEDAEPQESRYPAEMLHLRRSDLRHVPDSVLGNCSLTYLCLEGNQISSVPESMFLVLPRLQWLDLRKNLLTRLPAEIGSHRSLKTLLLEGNPVSELPPELGNVITLRGLNLRDCPIRFPPQDIVHQGLQAILRYLRSVLAARPVTVRKASPVMEKLQLSDLTESSGEEQEESVDEDGLQRFRELKDKLIQLDKAELSPAAHGDKKRKSHLPPMTKKSVSLNKESKETLQKQLVQAEIIQERKTSEYKKKKKKKKKKPPRQRKGEAADSKAGLEDRSGTPQRQTFSPPTVTEEDRTARKLERQIQAHVERIAETRRNPRGTMTEQMAAVEEDLQEIQKLQTCLLERRRYPWRHVDKIFHIYPEDTETSFAFKP